MTAFFKIAAGLAVVGIAAGVAALGASAAPRGFCANANGDCAMQQGARGYRMGHGRWAMDNGWQGGQQGWRKGPRFAQNNAPRQGRGQGMGPGGQFMMERFGQIDADGDGKITLAEIMDQREGIFYAMDADSSDDLTVEEFMAVRMGPGADNDSGMGRMQEQRQAEKRASFDQMDTDRNGTLSKQEWDAAGSAELASMDRNGDGVITADEFGPH